MLVVGRGGEGPTPYSSATRLPREKEYSNVRVMENYRKLSHSVYRCEYHLVWVPKYRYQILVADIKPRLKEIIRELCEWMEVTLIEGAICPDHIHLYVDIPPKHSVSHVMQILKGKSAERLRREFPELTKRYWGDAYLGERIFCNNSRVG